MRNGDLCIESGHIVGVICGDVMTPLRRMSLAEWAGHWRSETGIANVGTNAMDFCDLIVFRARASL